MYDAPFFCLNNIDIGGWKFIFALFVDVSVGSIFNLYLETLLNNMLKNLI